MGEVRVRVKLTNVRDEIAASEGQIKKEDVRRYEADAMVDTGAVQCVIPQFVMQQLGLTVRRQRVVEYADGRKETVDVTEPLQFDINGRASDENALVLGDEVLIGQTFLEVTDLMVDCNNRRIIPNPAHPDQPVIKIK